MKTCTATTGGRAGGQITHLRFLEGRHAAAEDGDDAVADLAQRLAVVLLERELQAHAVHDEGVLATGLAFSVHTEAQHHMRKYTRKYVHVLHVV